jgi:hypothetical protein
MSDEPQPTTETEVIVLDEHRERQKHNYARVARAQLAQARTQVQTMITNLEKDYSTRDQGFWRKAIACVLLIREAIWPYQEVAGADVPVNLLELKFKLMIRVGYIDAFGG